MVLEQEIKVFLKMILFSLNPCWGGIWSWRRYVDPDSFRKYEVLILVGVEYGLGEYIIMPVQYYAGKS